MNRAHDATTSCSALSPPSGSDSSSLALPTTNVSQSRFAVSIRLSDKHTRKLLQREAGHARPHDLGLVLVPQPFPKG